MVKVLRRREARKCLEMNQGIRAYCRFAFGQEDMEGAEEPIGRCIIEGCGLQKLYKQECIDPVALIFPAKDDAIAIANDSPFGLGGSVYTTNIERGKRVASRMETGMEFIHYPDVSWPDLPFGGVKRSGYGKELSNIGLEEFVSKKLILDPMILVPKIPA
jgi:acyl-CoA reductase-like NAD-dependent aldehyde dehydrogenase